VYVAVLTFVVWPFESRVTDVIAVNVPPCANCEGVEVVSADFVIVGCKGSFHLAVPEELYTSILPDEPPVGTSESYHLLILPNVKAMFYVAASPAVGLISTLDDALENVTFAWTLL
jgi:hypothetical protein